MYLKISIEAFPNQSAFFIEGKTKQVALTLEEFYKVLFKEISGSNPENPLTFEEAISMMHKANLRRQKKERKLKDSIPPTSPPPLPQELQEEISKKLPLKRPDFLN